MSICKKICWVIGVVAGLVAFWMALEPVSFIAALLLGIAVAVFLGLVLGGLFCNGSSTVVAAGAATAVTTSQTSGKAGLDGDDADWKNKAPSADTPANAGDVKDTSNDDVVEAEAAAKEAAANVKAEAEAKAKAKAEKAAKAKAAKAEKETAAQKAKLDAELGEDYDGDGVREGAGEGVKPEGLKAARGGKADDLKQIKGIGPKLETLCNEMGFYHFDQIASWGAGEVAFMNANLKGFKGRVSRDTWVDQATILAKGGETEFSKRVDKGGVYKK